MTGRETTKRIHLRTSQRVAFGMGFCLLTPAPAGRQVSINFGASILMTETFPACGPSCKGRVSLHSVHFIDNWQIRTEQISHYYLSRRTALRRRSAVETHLSCVELLIFLLPRASLLSQEKKKTVYYLHTAAADRTDRNRAPIRWAPSPFRYCFLSF